MRRNFCFGMALAAGLLATGSASAGFIDASATIASSVEGDGITYDYTITLRNSSTATDPIGTFWFAWLPGQDYMANIPISEVTPVGWKVTITHAPPQGNGYAIQWVSLTSASFIPAGGSLTFGFRSLETPAQLAGSSPFYPGTPEMTSVLYNAAPFSADSQTILVTSAAVPEPSALVLSLVGGVTALAGRRIARRIRA